ncbi:hypothetical protein [Kitasatospora sp. NPDC008115]
MEAGDSLDVEITAGVHRILSASLETPSGDEFLVDRLEPVTPAG